MKNTFLKLMISLFVSTFLLVGCSKNETPRIYLRQINTGTGEQITARSTGFFLLSSYQIHAETVCKLRAIGDFDGDYRFFDLNLNYVTFRFDSTATVPYIVVEYYGSHCSDTKELRRSFRNIFIWEQWEKQYIITCHPDLVPQEIHQVKI